MGRREAVSQNMSQHEDDKLINNSRPGNGNNGGGRNRSIMGTQSNAIDERRKTLKGANKKERLKSPLKGLNNMAGVGDKIKSESE